MLALYGIVYVKHLEKSRGRSTTKRILIRVPILIDLCAIAVICSFCEEFLLLPGILGGCVGASGEGCHDRALVLVAERVGEDHGAYAHYQGEGLVVYDEYRQSKIGSAVAALSSEVIYEMEVGLRNSYRVLP